MTNKSLKTLLFIVTFLFSLNAFAASWHSSYIERIYPLSDGSFVFIPVTPASLCTASNRYMYLSVGQNGMTQEGLDKIYAAALGAHLAHRMVSVNFDETSSNCWINRFVVF